MQIQKGIHWTQQAIDILRATYPAGGVDAFRTACKEAGCDVPHGNASIYAKASQQGLTKKNRYPASRNQRGTATLVRRDPKPFETVDIARVPTASMGRVIHGLDAAIDLTIEDLETHLSTLTANAQQVQAAIAELRTFAERRRAVVSECMKRDGR